jgi:hypothetical protein
MALCGCVPTNNHNPLAGKIKKITVNQTDTLHGLNETYTLDFKYNNSAKLNQVLYNGLDFIYLNQINNSKMEMLVKDMDNGFQNIYYVYSNNSFIDSITIWDSIGNQEINWYTFNYISSGNPDSIFLGEEQGSPYSIDLTYYGFHYANNYIQSKISWEYYLFTSNYMDINLDYMYTTNANNPNVPVQKPVYDVFGPEWHAYFNFGFSFYVYILNLNGLKSFKENQNLLESVSDSHENYVFDYTFVNGQVSEMIIQSGGPLVQNIGLEYY